MHEKLTTNKSLLIALIVGAMVVLFALSSISTYNRFVGLEEQLIAKDKDTQNVYASISNSLKSEGLSVQKYNDMVIQALNAAISGRYGTGGSKAAMQFIYENNPTIDSGIYYKLLNTIDANYARFESAQREKLDIVRAYKVALRTFPSNIVAGVMGFPKINLDEIGAIVTNQATQKAFQTHQAEAIDPFAK